MRRWRTLVGLLMMAAAACTVPDYTFVADDVTPQVEQDAAPKPDVVVVDTGPVEEPEDTGAPQPYDGAPITAFPMNLPSTNDFVTDCMFANIPFTSRQVVVDPVAAIRRCTIFYFSNPWSRPWAEARDACTQLTRGTKRGQLLTLLSKEKTEAVDALFNDTMTAWIGLAYPAGGGGARDRANWRWVNDVAPAYDGWKAGLPDGQGDCANWKQPDGEKGGWGNLPCDRPKGFLCEVDE